MTNNKRLLRNFSTSNKVLKICIIGLLTFIPIHFTSHFTSTNLI